MIITRSPRRHLPGFASIITRLDPSSSLTVILRLADFTGVRFSAAGPPAAARGRVSPCPSVSRIDSIKPHSSHLFLRRALPFTGNVAGSIAASGSAESTEETGRMSREAPAGGIHTIKAPNPHELNSITAMPMPHSGREGNLSARACTEQSCRAPKAFSVRWRA